MGVSLTTDSYLSASSIEGSTPCMTLFVSPSHSRKASRHYRYYVSQAILQYRDGDAGEVTRVPAPVNEQAVNKRIKVLLKKTGGTTGLGST